MSSSANYTVAISKAAGRDLKRLQKLLDSDRFSRIDEKIRDLAQDPRPPGCEPLEGGGYRIRDGDYRIVYAVDDTTRTVKVARVRDRKDVYRH